MTNITLEGTTLHVNTKGLFSAKTISLALDELRLVYLFLPETFKWRFIQTNVQYHYINLNTLTEESFIELSKLFLQQDSYTLGRTQIILKDFSDREVAISLKELTSNQINIFTQLAPFRTIGREKLSNWLRSNPQVKFGLNMVISAAGVGYLNKSYWMPWNALDKFTIFSTGSATIFNFIPTKASGLKQFGAGGIPVAQTQSCLAELEFWHVVGQQETEGVTN